MAIYKGDQRLLGIGVIENYKELIENSHNHSNAAALNKINEDAAGNPLYNGHALAATSVADNYSTEEQVIGTWIDGKPLYKRTFVTTSPKNTDAIANIVKLDTTIIVVNLYGYMNTSTTKPNHIPLNTVFVASTDIITTWIRMESGNLYIGMRLSNNSRCNKPCYITIEYTKTTD